MTAPLDRHLPVRSNSPHHDHDRRPRQRSGIRCAGTRLVVGLIGVVSVFAGTVAPVAAAPLISGDPAAYTEQEPPVNVGASLDITGGASYDGQYIEFDIGEAGGSETLALEADAVASTAAGAVSVVGTTVYLGDGGAAQAIGAVDATHDGEGGNKLRVNFTSPFENPGFEDGGTAGWNVMQQRIDLGVTAIAGYTTTDTATYPDPPTNDDAAPVSASWNVGLTTSGSPTEGTHALELESSMTTANGCDVVHGPAVYSNTFEAATGDSIYFDWRAFAGSDAYHVFGYILDEKGTQTEVLDAYTTDASGSTDWATKETVIPADGTYRFVFVAGTYDATCGMAAGASLLIDNLRVYGNKVDDAVATKVARKLTYANSSDDPPTSRKLTVTAQSAGEGAGSGSTTVEITPVDDAPTLDQPTGATFTNTIADDAFDTVTGSLTASDPDSTTLTFDVVGATGTGARTSTGTYSRLTVDPTTGAYTIEPDDAAIDAQMTATAETYTVTVTADGQTVEQALTVTIAIEQSPPGPPTITRAVSGDSEISLTWEADAWIGGAAVSDYHVEHSSDDGNTWSPFPDGTSTETTTTVTSLTPGRSYVFRVAATNGSGTGGWSLPSDPIIAKTRQDRLTVVASDFTYGDTVELSTSGGSGTGAVTYAVASGPCTVAAATLTASAVGTCTITATKDDDRRFFEATTTTSEVEVVARELGVRGATVTSRAYDGTIGAAIEGADLSGIVGSDAVSLSRHTSGTFAQAEPGSGIPVVTSMALVGPDAGNYTLVQPDLIGTIGAKTVTVTGATVRSKVYDGTTEAAITGATLSGVVHGDDVSLNGHTRGSFTEAAAGRAIAVVTSMAITGADADRYRLAQPQLSGEILPTPRVLDGAGSQSPDPGEPLSMTLCHLRPSSAVTGRIGDAVVGRAIADAEGCATVSLVVPAWIPAGTHVATFEVTDGDGKPAHLEHHVEVLGAEETRQGTGSPAILPVTGGSMTGLALVAAIFLAAGAALIRQPWRRRRHDGG